MVHQLYRVAFVLALSVTILHMDPRIHNYLILDLVRSSSIWHHQTLLDHIHRVQMVKAFETSGCGVM